MVGGTPAFPRGALGLPIVFHFQDNELPDQELIPVDHANSDRMASPVITKPLFVDGQYHSAFIFLRSSVDPNLKVKLKNQQTVYGNDRIKVMNGVPKDDAIQERRDPIIALQQYLKNIGFTSLDFTKLGGK